MGSEIDRRLATGTSDPETAENPAADPSVPT